MFGLVLASPQNFPVPVLEVNGQLMQGSKIKQETEKLITAFAQYPQPNLNSLDVTRFSLFAQPIAHSVRDLNSEFFCNAIGAYLQNRTFPSILSIYVPSRSIYRFFSDDLPKAQY
ncbi:MAG: hypothetical protein N2560_00300 [Ignavibacteria bacterium]|nr:hypothetical protein [Ignavibacteria bacterium]